MSAKRSGKKGGVAKCSGKKGGPAACSGEKALESSALL